MTFTPPATVALVGLGAIGGSVGLALRAARVGVVGFAGRTDSDLARRAGILTAETLGAAVRGAGCVLIAVPPGVVREAARVVREVTTAPVFHATSVQRAAALGFAEGDRMPIGTHPIAGSHRSGFGAADAALFRDARVSIEARADEHERACARWLWSTVGASRIEYRDAAAHDRQMAWVSHLPQVAGVALGATIAQEGEPSASLGPGGRDATRLAASRFELWSDILGSNADELVPALDAYIRELTALRDALSDRDLARVREPWERARAWREGARRK